MATNPFQQLDVIRNASQNGKTITDCYRLMYKKELWMEAHAQLYPNGRNPTNKNEKIKNNFRLQKMNEWIEQLKGGVFRFDPIRRVSKANGKANLLENTDFKDKIVQEVMRMVLESIYEPVFSNHSHGWREQKNCHTALSQIKNTWRGFTWCIKGDLNTSPVHFNPSELLNLLSKKIDDHRFLLLMHNALSSGVLEERAYHHTYSDKSKKGEFSSLLANIYLHEFDLFMEQHMKGGFIETIVPLKLNLNVPLSCPSKTNSDSRMNYVRFEDEFLIGLAGSKDNALKIKKMVKRFLNQKLHLELNEEKIHITHLQNPIPFLGYECCRQEEKSRRVSLNSHSMKQRTHLEAILLRIPKKKMREFVRLNGYGHLDNFKIMHRANLVNHTESEILSTYNAELRKMANYYKLASNYHHLERVFHLAESSFLKTIAHKRKSTSMKVASNMRVPKQGVLSIVTKDKSGNEKLHHFLKLKDLPNG
ncbi:Retron-type reverse transcriptase [Halobacillus karajensis]|uniref:Group II intron-encoded protein LtrA n=1 Tax=Halobacillus karajensis TaxID=195088 RepID=A0A024P644_9BACI|nr:reverse transcriptase/maturase family protein [Halobacillus karajensis]CDQ18178.1 Group II intron-encoded protein LtrA [Halobacillus karajensis]CDQ24529.1 Group II intron-encoded protein LtrA [Halobacillus karajensis]CDQ29223.1 Group II intron-encoded protein LtrA [Halobacillus karajensis]SEH57786.1 Retron-type reverse transcriptase [Halobacillus karajensis]